MTSTTSTIALPSKNIGTKEEDSAAAAAAKKRARKEELLNSLLFADDEGCFIAQAAPARAPTAAPRTSIVDGDTGEYYVDDDGDSLPNLEDYTPSASEAKEWDKILGACVENNVSEIRRLVEQVGVSPNHSNQVQQSALHLASLWGNVEAVKLLLEMGAEPDAVNTISGATPLHCIVTNGKAEIPKLLECMNLLLDFGQADPTIEDLHGRTPFQWLLCQGNAPEKEPLLMKLLERDPNAVTQLKEAAEDALLEENQNQQPEYQPPLFVAIEFANIQQVRTILQSPEYKQQLLEQSESAGASEPPFKYKGKSAFGFCFDFVLETSQTPYSPNYTWIFVQICQLLFRDAEQNQNTKFLVEAIGGGRASSTKDVGDTTTSAKKATGKKAPMYRICNAVMGEDDGEEENAADGDGEGGGGNNNNTAGRPRNIIALASICHLLVPYWPKDNDPLLLKQFHFACRTNNIDAVRFFVEAIRFDTNLKGKSGMTALHFACRSGSVGVVRYLMETLKAGICAQLDLKAKNDFGKTPLETAQQLSPNHPAKQEIVALLQL